MRDSSSEGNKLIITYVQAAADIDATTQKKKKQKAKKVTSDAVLMQDCLLVVFDLEHTGHGPYQSDIIQIAARAAPVRRPTVTGQAGDFVPADSSGFNVFCRTDQKLSYIMKGLPGFADLFTKQKLLDGYTCHFCVCWSIIYD